MVPMAKVTFKALLDWFVEQNASRWYIDVQASQFDPQDYLSTMNPVTGFIRLNISANATRKFDYDDEKFWFWSKFQGKEIFLEIPFTAIYTAVDPDTGIPNVFPYFEDYGDIEWNDENIKAMRDIDVLEKQQRPTIAEPGSIVQVRKRDGTNVEVQIPAQSEIDELNRIWREGSQGLQCDGFSVGPDGGLVIVASPIKEEPEPTGVVHVDFSNGGKGLFKGDATILNFPGTVAIKPPAPVEVLQIGKDSLETKITDRRWTVIEGGRQKPEASMPWIDVVYREKLARREAANIEIDRFVISNAMKSSIAGIRSDGSTGQSVFFPDLDVSKCFWPSKRTEHPTWLKVIDGGKA